MLQELFAQNGDSAAALTGLYQILLGGVPNQTGYTFLIETNISTNFGSYRDDITFNRENISINIANALVKGNTAAGNSFASMVAGADSLAAKVTALYNLLIPETERSADGLAYLVRSEGLAFYEQVAAERGVSGPDAAAIVALGSLLNVLVSQNIAGIGNSVNDLLGSVANGTAQLPLDGTELTYIEQADGGAFDVDDEAMIFGGLAPTRIRGVEIGEVSFVNGAGLAGGLNIGFQNETASGNETVKVLGGRGNDILYFNGPLDTQVTVSSGSGDDVIGFFTDYVSYGAKVLFHTTDIVEAGEGYDSLWLELTGTEPGKTQALLTPDIGPNIRGVEKIVHYSEMWMIESITVDWRKAGSANVLSLEAQNYSGVGVTVTNLLDTSEVWVAAQDVGTLSLSNRSGSSSIILGFDSVAPSWSPNVVPSVYALKIGNNTISVEIRLAGNVDATIGDATGTDADIVITGEGSLTLGAQGAYDFEGIVDLRGASGQLELFLGNGEQLVALGAAREVITGGKGNDYFVLTSTNASLPAAAADLDLITDFKAGEDMIVGQIINGVSIASGANIAGFRDFLTLAEIANDSDDVFALYNAAGSGDAWIYMDNNQDGLISAADSFLALAGVNSASELTAADFMQFA